MPTTHHRFETIDPELLFAPDAMATELEVEEEATLVSADSTLVSRTVPAHACGMPKDKKGKLVARAPSAITHVVIHTLQANYAGVIERWRTGRACFKPHYVVRNDGEITQIVAEQYLAQHANKANPYSVGIELDGWATDPGYFTEAMLERTAALVRDICARRGIPATGARIIGHDQAPGTTHGDPGGYFDWDYFLALVSWDGRTASTRPARVVVAADSYSVWPASPSSTAWSTVRREAVKHAPHPKHSWSKAHYRARPSTTDADPVVFLGSVPSAGTYELSAWWPVSSANNPAVDVRAFVDGAAAPAVTARVNQQTLKGSVRKTLALPNTPMWRPLGTLTLRAGSSFWVEVSRKSAARGYVQADAIRLLRR